MARLFFVYGLGMAWMLSAARLRRHASPIGEDMVLERSSWFSPRPDWEAIWYDLEPVALLLYAFWLVAITLQAHHMPMLGGGRQPGDSRRL